MDEIDPSVVILMAELRHEFDVAEMIIRSLIECQYESDGKTCRVFGHYRLVLECGDCDAEEKTTACEEHLDLMLRAAVKELMCERLTNHDLRHRYGRLSVSFLTSSRD